MVYAEIATLAISVLVLSKASETVVSNIAKLSKFFNISQVAIGFILLAVATSLPELSVSVVSSSVGEGALAAGNVFGSNIANILLVLGIGAYIYGMKITHAILKDIGLILLLTTLISVYIIFNSSVQLSALGFAEGVFLLALFAGYAYYTIKRGRLEDDEMNGNITKKEALSAFLWFSAGVVGVMVSSGFVVSSSVDIARVLGITESFIGATVIAIGTSLPELSIDIQAIRKKHYGIALGDAIGSNMVNLTLVLGTAAVIDPIEVRLPVFIAALLFAVIANSVLLYSGAVNRGIGRLGGTLFLVVYIAYIVTIFMLQAGELAP